MHTVQFKTFVNTGENTPQELTVEYIPESDMIIFSIDGHEIFNSPYTQSLEAVIGGITTIRSIKAENEII